MDRALSTGRDGARAQYTPHSDAGAAPGVAPGGPRDSAEQDAATAATLAVRYGKFIPRKRILLPLMIALGAAGNQVSSRRLGAGAPPATAAPQVADSTAAALRDLRTTVEGMRAQLTSLQSEVGLLRTDAAQTSSDVAALVRIRCKEPATRDLSEGAGICSDGRPVRPAANGSRAMARSVSAGAIARRDR